MKSFLRQKLSMTSPKVNDKKETNNNRQQKKASYLYEKRTCICT